MTVMKAFLREVRVYLEDLMSLNTLDNYKANSKKPPVQGDSRSLKTDDIEGAKPRSGVRRQADQGVYSGLNLPSYVKSSTNTRVPLRAQNLNSDMSLNAANFYGLSPPQSPKNTDYEKSPYEDYQPADRRNDYTNPPQLPSKEVANFYGATPPRSRAADPYNRASNNDLHYSNPEVQVPQKDLANFYGVTPPMSRSSQPGQDYLGNYARPPRVESRQQDPANFYPSNPGKAEVPGKVAAGFYGATPPASRAAGLNAKDMANFYGVTPPPTGKSNSYASPQYGSNNPEYNARLDMNYVDPQARIPANNDYYQDYQSELKNLPPKQAAQFYGVTPPPTGKPGVYSSVDQNVNNRNVANFYGATPPASGGRNVMVQPEPSYAGNGLSAKDMANFYGVTPPQTGSRNQGNQMNPNYSGAGPSSKDLANFYGVTPPPTGKVQVNSYAPINYSSNGANPNYYANPESEGVDPEFRYAADVASKPTYGKGNYEAHPSRGHNQVSTASRIFN